MLISTELLVRYTVQVLAELVVAVLHGPSLVSDCHGIHAVPQLELRDCHSLEAMFDGSYGQFKGMQVGDRFKRFGKSRNFEIRRGRLGTHKRLIFRRVATIEY